MRTVFKQALVASIVVVPLFAGALTLEIGNPAANPEAQAKRAVLVARVTACHSPEKTKVTATAEGDVNGLRKSIPLDIIPLSRADTYAVTGQWPREGTWAVKLSARNSDYKGYVTGLLVRFEGNSVQWASAEHYFHEPTDAEVTKKLDGQTADGRGE